MLWLIGLGGSLGAGTRYWLGKVLADRASRDFPISTWLMNTAGSFLLGLLLDGYLTAQIGESLWLFAGAGFCGAFTTFSTFGYETVKLLVANKVNIAILYVLTSVLTGASAALLGLWL
ncbi:fluoride efflux transporter CrcB [Lentibacillus cibarius]|uniref:Fluoride-specific ion channel FluC n=1 Tax=Lentibacillus cibarius TaxID=2583219 RepID=A0A549YGG7_9BACI|nr:fluoride efflux transporter CrcB [Lentibacillus cibarius]TRM10965.1 fluoride efflux transporter CrcB [Lentibacillus cibarius]